MGDATCHLVGRSRDQWVRAQANGLGSHDSGELLEQLNIPFPSMSDTLSSAENQLPARREEVDDSSGIVMKSPAMRRVMDLARRVANIESSVLITGESGVGKERVAAVKRFALYCGARACGRAHLQNAHMSVCAAPVTTQEICNIEILRCADAVCSSGVIPMRGNTIAKMRSI